MDGGLRKLDFAIADTGMSTSRSIQVNNPNRASSKTPSSKNPLSLSKRNTMTAAGQLKMEKQKSTKQLKKEEKYAQKLKDFK